MKITVIGGGVAGATTALAVRRATGAEVDVVEAYAEPAGAVGSYLSLAANGLRGLESLGCLPAIRAAGFDVPTQRMWGAGGRLLGEVARGRRAADDMHSVTLMRGALVETLRRAAIDAGVRIETGRRVPSPSDVDADLVVGADGIWSATRAHLAPGVGEPRYAGLYSVSGFSPGTGETGVFNMTFAAPGAFIHVESPDGRIWWSAQIHGDEPVPSLVDLYRDTPHVARILATATEAGGPIRHHVLGEVTRWHDDRVVLVGDAVHPVGAGQGAAMAIEDAVVLSLALARHGLGRDTFAAYAAERRDRVAKVLKTAGDNTGAKTAGPLKRRLNEVMMGLFIPRFYERATGWLYDFDPGTVPARG
ncbi:FAD-dependent monooxygenase [Phytomonospora endophytica]|uniref:2-polyprenyl-6-methoxyphenol hydroxylase-like FAD-dependent oxidoreductase n=1 Tax=Phytomonospora endophytica TaxID=714109 RepID=A0A841FRP5_9ACTN|nr:FAD-dependent monooxygenase [Phytomonospora endophytica]MBB6037483.1 2-polyprenyl-6-methoxyphenol hydroxylase-like FAD-dependent oxidoreductase [Phytomonospora endophytica]GIG70733.1 FAD-dependent oxidoreductase [Phytomonospora endophytica]